MIKEIGDTLTALCMVVLYAIAFMFFGILITGILTWGMLVAVFDGVVSCVHARTAKPSRARRGNDEEVQ